MKFSSRFLIPVIGITLVSGATLASDMLSVSGHARTKMQFVDNQGGQSKDATERWINRVRLNLDVAPSKSLAARLTPELAHTWGDTTAVGAGAAPAALTVREAWMSWKASDMATLYLGRGNLVYGRGVVIGNNDSYQGVNFATNGAQHPNYLDLARVRLSFDLGDVDVLYARVSETALVGTSDPADHDLYGFYAMLKPDMGAVANLDAYFLMNDNRAGNGGGARVAFLGLRADGDVGPVAYNTEVVTNFGKVGANDDTQKGIDFSLQVSGKIMDKHTIALDGVYANSETQQITQYAGRVLGDLGLFSRNNLIAFGLETTWVWADQWSTTLDGYYGMKAKTDAASTFAGNASTGTKRNLGMGAEFGLIYQAEKAFAIDATAALAKGGSALASANKKLITALGLGATLNF